MPNSCFVKGCKNRADGVQVRSFYAIPAIITHQDQKTLKLSLKRRQKWIAAIGREKAATKYSKVCSDHFITGKMLH
ncbi:hypothetical protein FSP39_008054 [Pinctada imbricata]|uniref:THAP-type domain-containing protein n=1 Tax=Pinctada imbricata TaxID=66713 RepID=A0AA89BX10_PINIB|nr:hypothetical protein FSP39_008054 [Pinctada imbricata]